MAGGMPGGEGAEEEEGDVSYLQVSNDQVRTDHFSQDDLPELEEADQKSSKIQEVN
jgi:hypothetical protein